MSSRTYVKARFEPDVPGDTFIAALDAAFAKIGATRVAAPHRLGSQAHEPIEFRGPKREDQYDVVDYVFLFYVIPGQPERVYRADCHSYEPGCVRSVHVTGETMGFLTQYDELKRDLAGRFFALAEAIHAGLNAAETIGDEENHDEPWFRFDRESPLRLPTLEFEPCPGTHMRRWTGDPSRPLPFGSLPREVERDRHEPMRPWRTDPPLAVEYVPRFGEFLLRFGDPGAPAASALLRTCLGCGGRFETSPRDTLYGRETDAGARAMSELAWKSRDLEAVIAALGPPELVLPGVSFDPSIDGDPLDEDDERLGVTRQVAYVSLLPESVVIFRQMANGLIFVQHAGKWLG